MTSFADSYVSGGEVSLPPEEDLMNKPPVAKYKLTLTIEGNNHEEIMRELLVQTRGGYLLNSEYETRDEWHVFGGRYESVMQHTNPDQTPELYEAELSAWFAERRASRAAG